MLKNIPYTFITIFAVLLLVASITTYPVQSDDLYMYLAIARNYFSDGYFSQIDPYFYPVTNYPWVIMHQWLGYLIYYGVFKLGGFDLIVIFKSILLLTIFSIPLFVLKENAKFL
ncbi:MAG: hypothetical protein H7281_16830 [Bacteriovorax sp.]|nr:hypothetical protein [Bacteriovorax sp.]